MHTQKLREALEDGKYLKAETYPDPVDIFDETTKVKWYIGLDGDTCVGFNRINDETSTFPVEDLDKMHVYADKDDADIEILDDVPDDVQSML